ncbi:2-octaprenyl-6-methoxyphenyl hydroxylase [Leptolyngbya valderiana BDU 20041]|nr:FAD-dependent hydroxylase [Geitlerinema sp. CS-897]OAB59900.1 2-octaprenyl-6-methoxyphenyl hydroxylase [Leptolyngbya valderiana BDU 20041]PPT09166.1 2-octaprenyl-6-methoxyphenol hydroxylase [Geitlerinema sp. FC II]
MSQEPLSQTQDTANPAVDCDVAIVGGGVAGTTLACALKDSGLRVRLLDAQTQDAAAARSQVYALTLLTGRILNGIGVWQDILPKITTFTKIRLSDGDRSGDVQFVPSDVGLDRLGYVAEHTPLLSTLQTFLRGVENVRVTCPAEVLAVEYGDDCATVTYSLEGTQHQLRARLVVGADGARSRVRTAAGIQTRGWQYWQSCVTFKVKPEKSHENIAYERFRKNGPFAILPLTGDRCNVVWSAPHGKARELAEMDEDAFTEELQRHYGDAMGRVRVISPRRVFPVQLMQSDRYIKHRVALVGDAAHRCHPVGGQGLNMGIRDVAALAQVIRDACSQGNDIGSLSVLERYERWRRGENWTILGFTDLLDRTFSNDFLPIVTVRQLGLWVLRNVQPAKTLALQLMTGLLGRQPKLARE